MKVNMVYPSNPKDGVHIYSQNLKKHLEKSVDIESFEVKKKQNPFYYFNLARNVSETCDILHLQFKFGIFGYFLGLEGLMYFPFSWGLRKNIKIITTFHPITNIYRELQNLKERLIIKKSKMIENSLIKKSNILISHTFQGKKILLKRGVGSTKVKIIPHGTLQKSVESNSKPNLGLDFKTENKKILTTFGYLRPGKGIERILEVIQKLPDNYIYLIAGKSKDREYFNKIKKKVKIENIKNRVKFMGFIPEKDIPSLMKITDLLIVPKNEEDEIILNLDSGPLNLGLSYNKVILTSNLEQFSEKEKIWNCIRTCDMDEPNSLKESIISLVENETLREPLKENTENFCHETSWEKIAKKTYELYKDVI